MIINSYKSYELFNIEYSGLFSEYINTMLKVKLESSGWPKWVKTDEDKAKYLRQVKEKEGIELDPEKIKKCPSLRSLAKLCLNSL